MSEDNLVSKSHTLLQDIANHLGTLINQKIIFGDLIKSGDVGLIPVSYARYGFGFGYGQKTSNEMGEGGGSGGGVVIKPVGYIEIKDNQINFKPIGIPIAKSTHILTTSIAVYLLLKGLANLFRR